MHWQRIINERRLGMNSDMMNDLGHATLEMKGNGRIETNGNEWT